LPCSALSKERNLIILEYLLLALYTLLLRLYPRPFRQDFAAEMHTVFGDALGSARREGLWAVFRLCGRELRQLPRALAREHWQSVRVKEAGMDKNMGFVAGKRDARLLSEGTPVCSWREIFAAILPFVLVLLADVLPRLLVESGLLTWKATGMQVLNIALAVLMIGAFLVVFFLAWRRKWPVWSATWYAIFVIAPLVLTGGLLSFLDRDVFNSGISQGTWMYLLFPLFLAVLLYTVTRRDPLRGLLAVLPVFYLLWITNMEFVPNLIQVATKIPSIALICLAIAFLLRRGNWRSGLYAILAVNLGVGILFSYAGIYHGGTLPFVASGPSPVEVARSLIPQYLATCAILLGPLFAWKIRQAGRSGGFAGEAGYHLALAGLLLVILANLFGLMLMGNSPSDYLASSIRDVQMAAIILGLGVYLLGIFFLYRDIPFAPTASGWAARLLLPLLPLAIPVTFMLPFITWRWPVSKLYGIPLLWVLPHELSLSIGLVWLALSVWVVTQGAESARTTAALGKASEALPLS
jgi:hypothetical protein